MYTMKRTFLLTALCLMLGTANISAQKKGIVLHYDFNKTEGTTVKDCGPHHADAQLINAARTENGCLVLDSKDAYLDMTPKAGEVLQTLSDFTVYVRYYVDPSVKLKGYGFFLWCFSCLEANKEKDGPYHAYRINEQRCETSRGGWSQETGIQVSKPSEQGRWINVLFRQKSGVGELYINGQLVGTEQGFPEFNKLFVQAPTFNWMGRAPFAGDKYLEKTKIDDFRIYDRCLNDKEVKKLTKE